MVLVSGTCGVACSSRGRGPWAGIYNRFLGVKFQISGQTHYGWVNVDMRSRTITGYAYETNAQPANSDRRQVGACKDRGSRSSASARTVETAGDVGRAGARRRWAFALAARRI